MAVCLTLLWLTVGQSFGQKPSLKKYGMANGMPGSNVYYALQDSKGYLWFATDRGVCRFNGYDFTNFDTDDGLTDNTIFEMFEDHLGRVWFATFNQQLSYYHDGKIFAYEHNDSLLKYVTPYMVSSFIHVTKKGVLYLGVYELGIVRVSANGEVHVFKNSGKNKEPSKYAVVELEERTYSAFIVGNTSMPALLGTMNPMETNSWVEKSTAMGLSSKPVVLQKSNGDYLFAGRKKIVSLSGNEKSTYPFFDWVINLYEDHKHGLWVSILNQGLLYYPDGNIDKSPSVVVDKGTFTHILQDNEGGYWFCTEGSGVLYSSSLAISHLTEFNGLSTSQVTAISVNGSKNLYVGYNNGKIDLVSPSGITSITGVPEFPGIPRRIDDMLYSPNRQNVLICASGQLFEYQKEKQSFLQLTPHSDFALNHLFESKDGTLYCGDKYGLYVWEKSSDEPKVLLFHPGVARTNIKEKLTALGENHYGNVLIGNYNGLFSLKGNSFEYLGNQHPLFKTRITAILRQKERTLIASRTHGLAIWNDDSIYSINQHAGLFTGQINDMDQMADGAVWLATNKGIYELKWDENVLSSVKRIGIEHGLPATEIHTIKVQDSTLWLGTNNGLVGFDMREYQVNNVAPPIHIESIAINRKDTQLLDTYQLRHFQNYLQISFLGIGYRNSGKLKYKYRMVGIDGDWQYTSERNVQYPTLPAGEYQFEVVALNEWNVSSTQAASLNFVIVPAWWNTWWAEILFPFAVISILLLLFIMRVKQIRRREIRRNAVEREFSEMKLKLLRAQMNPHFTFNTINSILDYIAKEDGKSARKYLSKFAQLLRYILESTEHRLNKIAEEVNALQLYLSLEKFRFNDKLSYNIVIDKSLNPNQDRIPTMLVQPLVENALLHGILPKTGPGHVKISFKKMNNEILVEVEDNGIGRTAAAALKQGKGPQHKSMSTGIIKDRLSLLNKSKENSVYLHIVDLIDDNQKAMGTMVQLKIANQ